MIHVQAASKNRRGLLAVFCGSTSRNKQEQDTKHGLRFRLLEIASSGHLEDQTLNNPSEEEFHRTLNSLQPNFVCILGEQLPDDEVGSLFCAANDLSSAEAVYGLFSTTLPTTAFHSKGIPYVLYWKSSFSRYAACHFWHVLLSVVQSSSSHMWDAFQLAHASYRLYYVRSNPILPTNNHRSNNKLVPHLLGDYFNLDRRNPPSHDQAQYNHIPCSRSRGILHLTIGATRPPGQPYHALQSNTPTKGTTNTLLVERHPPSHDWSNTPTKGNHTTLPIERHPPSHNRSKTVSMHHRLPTYPIKKIYKHIQSTNLKAVSHTNMYKSKAYACPIYQDWHNIYDDDASVKFLICGVTCTLDTGLLGSLKDGLNALLTNECAHISLLVSGSAQTCFDDQLILVENHIKSEIIENCKLVHALPTSGESKQPLSEPRRSASIACGATVFEVCMKVPTWALQVLRQLASDFSYSSLVTLGIASVQGLATSVSSGPPSWLRPPAPCRKRSRTCHETRLASQNGLISGNQSTIKRDDQEDMDTGAAKNKMLPCCASGYMDMHEGGILKANLSVLPLSKHSLSGSNLVIHQKSYSSSLQTKQSISLNPPPLKKHGCDRSPIHICSEEEFLKDVMQFLILWGHNRLIPQSGPAKFPDAIQRLGLFNLYREVVSRGGFHVGNGVNWKGQVISKMRNHTMTNRMTGVRNTLKRHYETYLLEYELAHDDVDGEYCLLCHSSAVGDWVNCGICGEWALFGCDRRQGLGAFKDYAKTDGLEYVCPQCSISNFKKKLHKTTNGYS
ncbi:hypothetical protein NMG60_11005891 [Bertholletia excelsa]